MSGPHLNHDGLARLALGEVTAAERRAWAEHLGGGCGQCERLMATLDREHEELVMGLYLERSSEDLGELGRLSSDDKSRMFEALESELGADQAEVAVDGAGWSGRRALALAAGLLLALTISFVALLESPGPGPIVKGDVEILGGPVFLQFLALSASDEPGASLRARRGVNRGAYSRSDRLMFRYQVDHPAWVYLVRVGPGGEAEYLYPLEDDFAQIRRAGFHDANRGAQVLLYPLSDLSGLQTFCALALPESHDGREAAMEMAQEFLLLADRQDNLSRIRTDFMDCFQVKVDQ